MKKVNNILIVASYKAPYSGNFIASLLAIYHFCTEKGLNCVLVLPEDASKREWFGTLANNNIQINLYDEKDKIWDIRRIIRKYSHSLVHFHHISFIDTLKITVFIRRKYIIKTIIHMHSDFSAGKKQSIKMNIYNSLKYLIFSRYYQFISVIKKHNDMYKNIEYIENGIVFSRLKIDEGSSSKIKLNLDVNSKLVIIFAWSPHVKGLDIAVDAIHRLTLNNNIVLGVIYGRQNTVQEMKQYIREHTTLQGDENWIKYLPPIEDISLYYNSADVFLSASRSEGFPYSICEALYMHKRCVISDIDSTKWASKYLNTHIFKKFDSEGCARAVEEALNSDEINKEVSEQIEIYFGINQWVKKVFKIYERFL